MNEIITMGLVWILKKAIRLFDWLLKKLKKKNDIHRIKKMDREKNK